MESAVHAAVPLRVGKKMRKRRELDALVGGGGSRGGRLLSASSDDGEPWGRRMSRRHRIRPFFRLIAMVSMCMCIASVTTMLWLFFDVRRQIVSLRIEVDRVSISSNGVGDALQICHTAAKELRANASELNIRLSNLELKHQELTERLNKATMDLATVSEQLSAAPKLADTPKRLGELQLTVADFGSQIKGFDSALTSTRKQAVAATAGLEEVRNLLQQLEGKNNDTTVHLTNNEKRESELMDKIVALNSTLVNRIDGLETKIEEMRKPASTAAPVTVVSSSVAPPATKINSTTPGPLKPIVLQ